MKNDNFSRMMHALTDTDHQVEQWEKLNRLIDNASANETLPERDNASRSANTVSMNDITREEFNARMETIEVKMDARVESVSSKIDAFMAVQDERDKRMEATVNRIDTSHDQIKSAFGSMKATIIVTAISTVLAIVIGIGGFNAMLTSNMISSFQMGRSELAAHKAVEQAAPAQPAAPPAQQK
ncbi:hypothetical protein [Pseudomonas sp. IPO3774]|uniref:hypothetical protein n=1 Tax=Pseudomonas sp. IPO3774 TaxID=2738826 RepID=UPI0015A1761D|nr:hypothetical protein [Pseudomonas sp. IPO3774]NWD65754.1 hypothetical protein [Pseudomonas sp. IPO3774]